MLERHLRRVYGDGAVRRRARPRGAARVPLLRPLLDGVVPAAEDAAGRRSTAGMTWEGVGHLEDALARGQGRHHRSCPTSAAGTSAAAWFCALGYPVTVVVERIDPPELFDWFVSLRSDDGHEGRAARARGGHGGAARPQAQRAGRAHLRPRHRRHRRRGRVLRRAHDAAERARRRSRCAPARPSSRPPCTSAAAPATTASCARRSSPSGRPLRDDVARVTQAVADELEALIRVAARPVAPAPAQLAQRLRNRIPELTFASIRGTIPAQRDKSRLRVRPLPRDGHPVPHADGVDEGSSRPTTPPGHTTERSSSPATPRPRRPRCARPTRPGWRRGSRRACRSR